MYRIDKQIDFCYGHRVWSQKLNEEFCEDGDTSCKCRHLHGHGGKVHIFLESEDLDRGMVTDFKHVGWLKEFLDTNLDHKFIVDTNDPLFSKLVGGKIDIVLGEKKLVTGQTLSSQLPLIPVYMANDTDTLMGYNLDASELSGPDKEFYEGFFLVDFVPTSENLCKWLYDGATEKMNQIGIRVAQIDWWETPKSRSSYFLRCLNDSWVTRPVTS